MGTGGGETGGSAHAHAHGVGVGGGGTVMWEVGESCAQTGDLNSSNHFQGG